MHGTLYTGGSGGYTITEKLAVSPDQKLQVAIGEGGAVYSDHIIDRAGSSLVSTIEVKGALYNGAGGSGGGSYGVNVNPTALNGGEDGENGHGNHPTWPATKGQGTTTRAFGESDGTLYAGGGGGCALTSDWANYNNIYRTTYPLGGRGGGGRGCTLYSGYGDRSDATTLLGGSTADANTGGGGGAGGFHRGGTGIAIIRWGKW